MHQRFKKWWWILFGCTKLHTYHCIKIVRIRSYSGPYFPAFELNAEIYGASFRLQSKCRKIRTRITPNTDTFYAVYSISGDIFPIKEQRPENKKTTSFNHFLRRQNVRINYQLSYKLRYWILFKNKERF